MSPARYARTTLVALLAMLAAALVPPGPAVASGPVTVIDDFEDGDTSDWGFFGGVAAGGGGGPASDRPHEGGFYFSTGWGGEGTASGFYGGAFKNFPDAAQPAPPADPWLNVWVFNQSDATSDGYRLELTIREDTDGNGWTNGVEDSFRFDTIFTSADYDDAWRLVSAPVSSFTNAGTGGNGVFDGALDEVVLVIAGVTGANPSTVEVDFDLLSFTSGGPAAGGGVVVFDDMEHGNPFGNGWFSFNGAVGGGGIASSATVPPGGGAFSLETGWGSGGTAGFYGGFGRTSQTDLSGTDHFNFWIDPDGGQEYTLELNLQEDDDGNGAADSPTDDEFQFDCLVGPAGPCAIAGGGWQLVSIPLADFFDDNSFFTGGNGVLDAVPPSEGGNGELVNVVVSVIGTGSDATFRTDDWVFSDGPLAPGPVGTVVDDMESGVAPGTPCAPSAPPLGYCTFNGAGSSVTISDVATPPGPVLPEVGTPNTLLQLDVDATSFAGVIRGFESGGEWVSQDWSTSEGVRFWFHGTGSGTDLFVDLLDNRNEGSTTDDAERWTVTFVDDVPGWRLLEFPFSAFTRKEIGNGAPNDGLGLFEVHGWAIGTLGTGGARTFHVDEVGLYGVAEAPPLAVQLVQQNTVVTEGETAQVGVKLNRAMGPDDPAEVSIDYATERSYAEPGLEYTPVAGTLTFVNGGATEQSFAVETFDDTKFEGDEQVVLRLTDPVDVERGSLFQGSLLIDDDDPFDADLLDDFERGPWLWETEGPATFDTERVAAGDAEARPGQDAVDGVGVVSLPVGVDVEVKGRWAKAPKAEKADKPGKGKAKKPKKDRSRWCETSRTVVPVHVLSSPTFDATTIDHTTLSFGGATETHVDKRTGEPKRHVDDVDGDGRPDLVLHVRASEIDAPCNAPDVPLTATTVDGQQVIGNVPTGAAIVRDFPLDQDWSDTEALTLWYRGDGSGSEVEVTLKDNRAPDPGPAGWELVFADEFDGPAGTPPDPDNWGFEVGDTTPDGKNGWGNEERQYYTDDPANASLDGDGNLVLTMLEDDSGQECYYGPCEYTSARLLSQDRAEFAYGRIESRLKVPDGGDGLWPAFWSLGTDIRDNPWPAAGEIDVMEYVSRLPNEIFGTIHGPGYNGGGSYSGIFDFGEPVPDAYHTFAVEWQPDLITWFVDGIQYHQAAPSDVPGPWVFEKPFFLLLNLAIGGNFGGEVDPDLVFPQEYLVDYVRVHQAPDTAERFVATFTDDTAGWQQVTVPIGDFVRAAEQPAGAPDDGLTLDEVWGYGLAFPRGTPIGEIAIDSVRRVPEPPPTELVVTTLDDGGPGSLRAALGRIAPDGLITFDPSLAGGTIGLDEQLLATRSVTIDASDAPGLVLSGLDTSRVLEVAAGTTVTMTDLTIADGAGAPQGGGVLNRGDLTLERVVVRDNTQGAAGPGQFDLGGGGVYSGADASLTLVDSTVSGNTSTNHPGGGLFGFFGSTTTIVRSTVSGNLSGDVAGGLRSLGDVEVTNSTFSGNTSTAWHGGGIFHTDGSLVVRHSTFSENVAPVGTASGIVVATFGAPADATLTDNVLEGLGGAFACASEGGGLATIASDGGNVISDGSCNPGGSDQSNTDALLGPLADNGGPTLTHLPGVGSPAIDAAAGACPATDQRGLARPAGPGCDAGAVEVTP